MIGFFRGKHRFLSNFYPSEVSLDGILYPSIEHAYQAAKTIDITTRREIAALKTPGQAKRRGRRVILRSNWEHIKEEIMYELVLQKFARHPVLRQLLLATGEQQLVEGNTWGDTYWGVCDGEGQNRLGKILERVRFELQ